jgi:BolA protein
MNKLQRITKIKKHLETLEPVKVQVIDESANHIGHVGALDGRGHYAMKIVSHHFNDKTSIERHQMVYQALGKLMKTDIHALKIKALTPNEETSSSPTV